ncbi:MAG TPA: preprotein translocase subunit SecA [Dehalococcoidales bacterium]|nr:preprotein translocase subunit SecA [Dehalococcoidales bacterium]
MFKRLFGGLLDSNEKEIDRLKPIVTQINSLEPEYEKLSAEELRNKTAEFKTRVLEATLQWKQAVESAQNELDEKHRSISDSVNALQQQEIERECKDLESRVKKCQDDLRAAEKKALDDILPEAFAAVREAAKRTLNQRHFDVQLIGGIILHRGKIAEMKTGEGKTLVATCPLYLNSLTGRGVHLVTQNDYLARRDPYWMGPIYHALGVSVASIFPMQNPSEHQPSRLFDSEFESGDSHWKHYRNISRQEAYRADITYGTSSEFGFDFLRDNMVIEVRQCVQRDLNYAIVDEVDNLLIDEARTPLIISGPAEDSSKIYKTVNNITSRMSMKVMAHEPVTFEAKEQDEQERENYDYVAYEKEHTVRETPRGQEKLARAFNMSVEDLFGGETEEQKPSSLEDVKYRNDILSVFRKSMQAHTLYKKDRDYVIRVNEETNRPEIIIVDVFTGRLMLGRRYSEGLHQAIEAKEGVPIQRESMTFATITIQNYFRMYSKLAGMTGTAMTEAEEFSKIYKLDVVSIPTNKPMIREDYQDRIYKDEKAKYNAIVSEIEEVRSRGQPILVGTVSIEKSERLGEMLRKKGISARILNASPARLLEEASIVAEAGKPGAVTIATNMAGRGVDIVLGGKGASKSDFQNIQEWEKEHQAWQERHNKVVESGGLHVIGTERHEARRIDNQLRGRSGRQGDPGSTRFYVALDDDIMKRFGGERIKKIMNFVRMDDNIPIENSMVSKTIENSQIKVEGFHFDIRKHLVEFDDVVNKHREVIYAERHKIITGVELKSNILNMLNDEVKAIFNRFVGSKSNDEWDLKGLLAELNIIFPLPRELNQAALEVLDSQAVEQKILDSMNQVYEDKEKNTGSKDMRLLERLVMLKVIDGLWVEHLTNMENQRQQANFATLQQVKAQDAYKRIGFEQFQQLTETIQQDVARMIFHVNIRREEDKQISTPVSKVAGTSHKQAKPAPRTIDSSGQRVKVGRNDPCHCGSGKKYKHCHGKE